MQIVKTALLSNEDVKNKFPYGDPLSVIQEFLGLLTEFQHPRSFYYLSVLESLLHFLIDVETTLALQRPTLEQERLIHNDLQKQIKGTIL